MKKVVVHYPFVAHYRVPVFNKMSFVEGMDIEVWSSSRSKDKFMLSDKKGWAFKHFETLYFVLFNRFEFEFGVFFKLLFSRPDFYIVLGNPNILTSWFYVAVARLIGCKVVYWTHGMFRPVSKIKGFIYKVYYCGANMFFLYGDSAKKNMIKLGYKEECLSVIYNSLDYDSQKFYRLMDRDVNALKAEFGVAPESKVLVATGRLLPKLMLDEAILEIEKFNQNSKIKYTLMVVGDGPELPYLKSLVEKNNCVNHVKFLGSIYEEEILSKLYCIADASLIYGVVGLAAMHSLAYGVPVITRDDPDFHCPEFESIDDGITGLLFGDKAKRNFSDCLRNLKEKSFYSQACVETIEDRYSPDSQVRLIKKALFNV